MAATSQRLNHKPPPAEVELTTDGGVRFTPRELRIIKDQTGRSFAQIAQDDSTDERFTVLAWLKLRRDGYDLDLADMDDIVIGTGGGDLDPTSVLPSTTLPRSVDSGE